MLPTVKQTPTIAIVGAGNLGSALAVSLHLAGCEVREIVSREGKSSRRRAQKLARRVRAHATTLGKADITAQVIWLCVPDREIRSCAEILAKTGSWKKKVVVHSSGALSSDEIAVLQKEGASIASAHPLMTFVSGVTPPLRGVSFAVEGDVAAVRVLRRLVSALGSRFFPIKKQHKAAYHAWGTFVSPLLTALLAMSERVARAAGVRRQEAQARMLPIIRQTIENYARQGAAGGFSGPIVRGDAGTVAKHLDVLREVEGASEVYRALAWAALRTLPAKNRRQVEKVLQAAPTQRGPNGARVSEK
jgi:predicted short-subunit dehydrogenase-like oxidoreductase (DUF2520 family)